ncbi:MAG: hypothetical protein L0H64_21970, partial [Pseudonocardia sp.]|nr:hypothetical protein [Pseudonocardia sp.]
RPDPWRRGPAGADREASWHPVALVVAGALVVLLGAGAGWTVTRLLGGQSPLGTITVTSAGTELRGHLDRLGFDAGVPVGWSEFPVETLDGERIVSFVSPDGTEELTVRRMASAEAATAALTPDVLGVDAVTERTPLDDDRLRYRTNRDGQERVTWMEIVPSGDGGVWTVRLTVPGDRSEARTSALFDRLMSAFGPADA